MAFDQNILKLIGSVDIGSVFNCTQFDIVEIMNGFLWCHEPRWWYIESKIEKSLFWHAFERRLEVAEIPCFGKGRLRLQNVTVKSFDRKLLNPLSGIEEHPHIYTFELRYHFEHRYPALGDFARRVY